MLRKKMMKIDKERYMKCQKEGKKQVLLRRTFKRRRLRKRPKQKCKEQEKSINFMPNMSVQEVGLIRNMVVSIGVCLVC